MNHFQVIFNAGTDNSSTTIEWATSELRNDEIKKNLREEYSNQRNSNVTPFSSIDTSNRMQRAMRN